VSASHERSSSLGALTYCRPELDLDGEDDMRRPVVLVSSLVLAVLAIAAIVIGAEGFRTSSSPSKAAAAGTAMAMSTSPPSTPQAGTPLAMGTGFVGSWQPIFTVGGQPSPAGLATFAADGTFTGDGLAVPPGLVAANLSPSHGVWNMIGPSTAALITISNQYDTEGNVVGAVTYRMRLMLIAQGQGWSGTFIAAVANSIGQVTTTYSGTVQAMRINLLPAEILPPGTPGATPQP
jgi:hypothetical protein